MNKNTFLHTLRKQLKRLKPEERNKHLSYYEEMIADMMENGMTEEESIEKIGSPDHAAQEILANTAPENLRPRDLIGRVLIITSVLLALTATASAIHARRMMNTAISIIGGADGPTSIFIAGRVSTMPRLTGVAAVVILITVVYFIRKKKR